MTTICLNMIVKNESRVIARCLRSVRHLIDCYVIVDTGSTDDTKEIIERELEGVPGEVYDRPWVDFGHNRSEAIQLAAGRSEYLLVVDADDEIRGPKPEGLNHDCYSLMVHEAGGLQYERAHIFRNDATFHYVGVLHEYLDCTRKVGFKGSFYHGLKYVRHPDGSRWGDGGPKALREKFLRDANVLQQALASDPTNERYQFYLGQSLRDAGELRSAINAFYKRTTMKKSNEQERWYALYQVAHLQLQLDENEAEIIDAFLRAFEERPTRIEPMYELAKYLQRPGIDRHQLCYHLLKPLVDTPLPNDRMFVDVPVYAWGLKDLLAVSAHHVGDHDGARKLNEEMLISGQVPAEELPRIAQNLAGCARSPEQAFAPMRLEKNHLAMDSFFGDFFGRLREAIAPGGSEFGLGLSLFSLAVSIRAESIVEIGRFKGFSTFAFAAALKFLTENSWEETPGAKQRPNVDYERLERVGGVRKVYSIDPYPTPEAAEIIEANGLRKYVTFFDRRSDEVDQKDMLRAPDIIFIDGDHSRDGCMDDVKRYVPMLRPGGYFILHDYFGWFDAARKNNSPIKKVADELISQEPSLEHLLMDTGYMSFIIFRKKPHTLEERTP